MTKNFQKVLDLSTYAVPITEEQAVQEVLKDQINTHGIVISSIFEVVEGHPNKVKVEVWVYIPE